MNSDRIIVRVVISKKDAYGEYCCKAYDQHGKRYQEADYFTDDKQDAENTMAAMLEGNYPY
jgi:hypothetical protein